MEEMSNKAQEENEVKCKVDIKNRLNHIEQELNQGWIIYGKYMDTQKTGEQIAMDVREVIRAFTEEKSSLLMMLTPDEALKYVERNKEKLNASR